MRARPWPAEAKQLLRLVLVAAVSAISNASRQLGAAQVPQSTDRLIVRLNRDSGRAMALADLGLKPLGAAGSTGAQVVQIADGSSAAQKAAQLNRHPAFSKVEVDQRVRLSDLAPVTPNDPRFNGQWHLTAISAAQAWGYGHGGDIKVCHVDGGVQKDHPDLAPNILTGFNLVPTAPGGATPEPGSADWEAWDDNYGHGTHTAGLIAAVGNNGVGVSGVVWRIKLVVCKFAGGGSGYISDAMRCLKLCSDEGAMIASNSWGGIPYSDFLKEEIQAAGDRGQLFVTVSGNSGVDLDASPQYPASYNLPNIISVASVNKSDGLSAFCNTGANTVGLAAPGEELLSTSRSGDYELMSGTSMSVPLVSGAAALLQAMAAAAGQTLSVAQLRSLILSNVDVLPSLAGKVRTGGRLNVGRAAKAAAEALGVPAAAVSPRPSPSPAPTTFTAARVRALAARVACGSTVLRNARTSQSSTSPAPAAGSSLCGGSSAAAAGSKKAPAAATTYAAARAVDGRCSRQWTAPAKGGCAISARQDYPWWQAQLQGPATVLGVALTVRGDCGWSELAGAQVLLGSRRYSGSSSGISNGRVPSGFQRCGAVPAGVPRSGRIVVSCTAGIQAKTVLVLLPRKSAQLALCEVDVLTPAALARAAAAEKAAAAKKAASSGR